VVEEGHGLCSLGKENLNLRRGWWGLGFLVGWVGGIKKVKRQLSGGDYQRVDPR